MTNTANIPVLHVDDGPDFADMAADFLEREEDRLSVETTTSASKGLDRLADEEFDCIVSDYEMPGQNGIEFLETIRQDHPDLPFILYTGKGSEEVASDAISAGVTDYLQKETGTSQYTVLANRIVNAVEQYYTQTELADREQRLNLFFEQSPLGVIEWDENFNLARINDTVEEILGYAEDDLAGRSWEAIVPESDRIAVADIVAALLENKGGYHSINKNVRKDGKRIICEWHNRVVTDEDDEVVAIFSQFQDITERKKRQRRFEAVFNNTYTFTGLMEPDGTLIEVNETALDFGGLDRDDVVGERLWNAYWVQSNDDAQSTVRDAVEHARNGDLFRDEIQVQGSDEDVIIDFSVRPITDEQGEVTLLVPEGRDITERKQQERKYEQVIDRVTDAIVEVSSDWEFTLVNEQAEALYGMDEEDLLGRSFWDVFTEAKGTRFEEEYRAVMETRDPTSFTEYYDGLDGWFDIDVYPKDDGGVAFYFREVTDRVERSRELERQNEQFQYVEKVADIGYWEIDAQSPEPHNVTLSDGVYQIHELAPDEPFDVEKGLQFYHPKDRPRVEQAVERAISDGEQYDHEVCLITATGRKRWVHSVGEPVERDGEVVKVRGVLQDITDRKQKEQELSRQNEQLDEFASIVSHDLQNPLNVAQGRLELVREGCDSDHLDDVAEAHQRMETLIDDLLTLAREGERVAEMEAVDLATVLDRCWETVETADATLVTETKQTIQADSSRLKQLLENLFHNAVEHAGDDVTVTVGELDDRDGFYVADDGPGLSDDERDRVFEAGYSTKDEGTGFGLNIVQGIVDTHGWDIAITDSETGGARFEITGVETIGE